MENIHPIATTKYQIDGYITGRIQLYPRCSRLYARIFAY